MSNEIAKIEQKPNGLISAKELEFAENLSIVLKDVQMIKEQSNPIVKEMMMANAKVAVENLLTDDLMVNVYKLFGDPLGVKMDKPYDNVVRKRIFIQAVIGGWGLQGNQINILGGNMYITYKGYLPRLRKISGLKFIYPFRHHIPIKNPDTFTTTVTTDMEWTLNGVEFKETLTYPVTRNEGQGNDAILGKATTKMCCWLWNKLTGEETIDDSGSFVEAEIISSQSDGSGEKIEVKEPVSQGKKSDVGEEVHPMLSEEYQAKFDGYMAKATSFADLLKKACAWCESKAAKDNGATYVLSPDGMVFESHTIDLKVFNELAMKFNLPAS